MKLTAVVPVYNEVATLEACLERSKLVLDAMVETGVLSDADRKKALATTPRVYKTSPIGPASTTSARWSPC